MPGKVIAISVKTGDAVKAGAPLVVLEAMKMEHTLRATSDGIVARLNVALGDQVTDGALIVALEAPSDATAGDATAKGAARP
jgi:3-methylcrotonyl-CoA carboxylase alpha subunit